MTEWHDHDPLCPSSGLDAGFTVCICDPLRAARADERERIAQAIEDRRPSTRGSDTEVEVSPLVAIQRAAYDSLSTAARIARGES